MPGREPLLLAQAQPPEELAAALEAAWAQGCCVGVADPADRGALELAFGQEPRDPDIGAAVVLSSGGSSGFRRWCLQPLAHLEASAAATATWLELQGLDPGACLHLDPLPLHHVSGLLPLLRCRRWQAELRFLPPAWLRDPEQLGAAVPLPSDRPVLLSVVPTQLLRLIASPHGLHWLRGCAVIWVGGAALPAAAAALARREGLRLAPCYGSTETAAMVCALPPEHFLSGVEGCGPPLADAELRRDPGDGALEIRADRLALGWLEAGRLQELPRDGEGWWRSGDAGQLHPAGLQLLGRLDGAISSGGETVFPEQVGHRLTAAAREAGLPLRHLVLVAEPDPLWGERLVALVRGEDRAPTLGTTSESDPAALIASLMALAAALPASQRPRRWLACPELAPSPLGKWQRQRWQDWLQQREAEQG